MRFRLATSGAGGGGQELAGGVGNLFRSISMAPAMAAQAAEEGRDAAAVRELRAAQANQANAQSMLYGNQAREIDDQRTRSTPGAILRNAAMIHGVAPEQQSDLAAYIQSGRMAGQYVPGPDEMGPVLPAPAIYNDGTTQKVMRTAGFANQGLAAGDKNIANLAMVEKLYRDMGLGDDVLAGRRNAADVGQSQAAMEGKKVVDAIASTGMGYNMFTGKGQQLDEGLRVIFGDEAAAKVAADQARAGASRASAASSYASADNSRASAAKTREELERGVRTGDLQVVTGQDGAITVVNKRTLSAQPVLDSQGRPVIKGAAGGGGKALTEGQAKANIFGGRMMESDKILTGLEGRGVQRPGTIKSIAEGTGRVIGLGTDSMGGTLSDIAGSATNWTQSADQQSVDQARRDFINAVLRRESGATIQPAEFANAEKQYFPQPGDSQQVIEQKRRNRQISTQLMLQEVPEAQRYRPRSSQPGERHGGSSGGWDAPGVAGGGWSIQRVE